MHEVKGIRALTVIRAAAFGIFLSTAFALAASGAFLLAQAVLRPDRWWTPGVGWVAVLAVTVALTVVVTVPIWRAIERAERARYTRANRRG